MDYEETKKDAENKRAEAGLELRRLKDITICADELIELLMCISRGTDKIYLPKLDLPDDATILAVFPSNHPSQHDAITLRIWSSTFEPVKSGDRYDAEIMNQFSYSQLYQKVKEQAETVEGQTAKYKANKELCDHIDEELAGESK